MTDYFHYYELILVDGVQPAPGRFVALVATDTLQRVDLFADPSGTPIVSVSGVANMAKTDDLGNVSAYVAPNTYHVDIYEKDATTFVWRIPNVSMTSAKGEKGDQGPQGATGPADNTYSDLAVFKGSGVDRKAATLTGVVGVPDGRFFWETANAPYTADDTNIIKSDANDLSVGAWVRQAAANIRGSDGSSVQVNLDRRLPSFATLTAASGASISSAHDNVQLAGHTNILDQGAAQYRRVDAEPAHSAKFQSADGGWWEIAEERVGPHHFGALAGADATQGWQDAIDYMHLADRPIFPIDGLYTLGGERKGTNNTLLSIPDGANVRIIGTGEGCRLFVPDNFTAGGDYMMMGHAEVGMTCGVVEIRGVHFDGNGFNNPVVDSTTHLRRAYAIRLHRGDTVIVADCFFSAIPGRVAVLLGDNGTPIPFQSISILDNRFVDMGGAIPGCEGQNDHSSIYTQSQTAIVRGNVLINTNADFDPQATPFRSCTALEVQSINAIVEGNQIVNFGTGGNAVAVLYDVNEQKWLNNQFLAMKQNVLKPYTTMHLKRLVIRGNLVEIDNSAGNGGGSGFFQDPNAPTGNTKYAIGTLVIEDNDFVCLNDASIATTINGIQACAVDNLYVRRNRFANWQGEGVLLNTHAGALGISSGEIDENKFINCGIGSVGSAVFSLRIVNSNTAITFSNITIGGRNRFERLLPAVGATPPFTRGIRISGPGHLDNIRIEMPEFFNMPRTHRLDFTSTTNNHDVQVLPRQRSIATAATPDAGFFDVGRDMIVHSDWAAGGSLGRVPTTGGCAFEATWAASTDYVKGQWIKFSSTKYGKVVVGGTSGSTTPDPDTLGETFTDGTVTWLFVDTAAAAFKTFGAIAA